MIYCCIFWSILFSFSKTHCWLSHIRMISWLVGYNPWYKKMIQSDNFWVMKLNWSESIPSNSIYGQCNFGQINFSMFHSAVFEMWYLIHWIIKGIKWDNTCYYFTGYLAFIHWTNIFDCWLYVTLVVDIESKEKPQAWILGQSDNQVFFFPYFL